MKASLVLGIVGCVFGFMAAIGAVLLSIVGQDFNFDGASSLYVNAGVTIVGSVLGLVGGAMGKKAGGVAEILGGIIAFVGSSLFAALPLVLFLVGGALALREKPERPLAVLTPSPGPVVPNGSMKYCTHCGTALPTFAEYCSYCGMKT